MFFTSKYIYGLIILKPQLEILSVSFSVKRLSRYSSEKFLFCENRPPIFTPV